MPDQSPFLPPPFPPPTSPSAAAADPLTDPKEIAEGKAFAALCYPIWIIALVMLFVRNNAFALYHAKQMMAMTIVHTLVAAPLICILMCAGAAMTPFTPRGAQPVLPCFMLAAWGFAVLLGLWAFAMVIVGLVNALNGKAKPLPLYGFVADKLFTGLNKK